MKNWLNRLEPREVNALILACIIFLGAVLYLLAWEPVAARHEQLETTLVEQRKLALWMEQAALRIRELREGRAGNPGAGRGQSLLALVDQTSKSAGLGPAIKRIEPEGEDRVRVWLDDTGFDTMIRWLTDLARNYRTNTASINVDRADTPGRVNAKITLNRPG